MSPKIHIGEYPHEKLETLRVIRVLEVQICEWDGLESRKFVYSVGAWQRLGESFMCLDESVRESLSLSPFRSVE